MQGIIYVAHGSKLPEKNQQFRLFIDQVKQFRPERVQRIAFLEKDDENVPLVIADMLREGVKEFIVMPMLLFPAMHAVEDIPQQVKEALEHDSSCSYVIADCFGSEESVWKTALKRLETDADTVLITAHGNKRYKVPDQQLIEVVKKMQQQTTKQLIPAMLYGELSFEQQLQHMDSAHVAIMPYFLFDGHLVRKIKRLSEPFIAQGMQIDFMDTLELDLDMVEGVLHKLEEAECIQ